MAGCSKFAHNITRIAMNIGSQPGMNTLDKVLEEMQKELPVLTREALIDAILEATTHEKKQVDELAKQISALKQEARSDKKLRQQINDLQKYLETGTLPPKTEKKNRTVSPAIEMLKEIRSGLKRQLSQSEAARKERLIKSIERLDKKIESGDIFPKQRTILPTSEALEELEYQKKRREREIRVAILEMQPKTIWDKIADPFNAARSIITSLDLSGLFRQGGFIAFAHPVRAAKVVPKMMKAFTSEKTAIKINSDILKRKNAPLYDSSKLYIAPLDGTERLSKMEEAFMSRLAEKIPLVRASERAYVTVLNVLRADSFDAMCASLCKNGRPTQEEAKAIANFINVSTGRGSLGAMERAAVPLNTIFFAPRYSISRFQLLAGQPIFKANSAKTRKMIAGEYARYLIGMATVYTLAALMGGDTEDDPRSSDFGKIRFGRTRLDPLSGISQATVLLSRVASGKTKSTTTGKVSPIRGKDVKYGMSDTYDFISRFLRGKMSPMFSTATNVLSGENLIGEPVTPISIARDLTIPLAMRDVFEAIQDQGVPAGTAMSIIALFGMGLQTYGSKAKSTDSYGTIPDMMSIKKPAQKKSTRKRVRVR